MIVVSNSTALVHLSAIGRLTVLHELFSEIHIPDEVYEEVVVRGAGKPGAAEVQASTWVRRQTIANTLAFSILNSTMGAGEAACIVLATELKADLLILDDQEARIQAESQGCKVTGTVGILLTADTKGLLDFQQTLDDLLGTGFRLSTSVYQQMVSEWKAKRSQTP